MHSVAIHLEVLAILPAGARGLVLEAEAEHERCVDLLVWNSVRGSLERIQCHTIPMPNDSQFA